MHLVHQHKVTIDCGKTSLAHQLKGELGGVLERDFYPRLNQLMASYDADGSIWKIDNLPVHLPKINAENWKEEIVKKSLEQVKLFLDANCQTKGSKQMALDVSSGSKKVLNLSRQEQIQQLFISYIQTGALEKNVITDSLKIIFEELDLDLPFALALKRAVQLKLRHMLRWSINVPMEIKELYLKIQGISLKSKLSNIKSENPKKVSDALSEFLCWIHIFDQDLMQFTASQEKEFLDTINRLFSKGEPNLDNVKNSWTQILSKMFPNNFTQTKKSKLEQEPKSIIDKGVDTSKIEDEEIFRAPDLDKEIHYINNAGLVLLHPFLKSLFGDLGLLRKDDWKDTRSQHRAVLLLQYLVHFEADIFENDLVLNKILCGVDPGDIVNTQWKITKRERETCADLLKAVIAHWKVLKNTSITTLQESFLQRSAKIMTNSQGCYEITVEQKGIDLLLDQLPWGFGMIKTPWLKDYISCQWN